MRNPSTDNHECDWCQGRFKTAFFLDQGTEVVLVFCRCCGYAICDRCSTWESLRFSTCRSCGATALWERETVVLEGSAPRRSKQPTVDQGSAVDSSRVYSLADDNAAATPADQQQDPPADGDDALPMAEVVKPPPASRIRFRCSECDRSLNVKEELAGKRIKCPGCGHVVLVPGGAVGGYFDWKCDQCFKVLKVKQEVLGERIQCPACGHVMKTIPHASQIRKRPRPARPVEPTPESGPAPPAVVAAGIAFVGLIPATFGIILGLSLESPFWQAMVLAASCLVAGGCLAGAAAKGASQPAPPSQKRGTPQTDPVADWVMVIVCLSVALAVGLGAGMWVFRQESLAWQLGVGIPAGLVVAILGCAAIFGAVSTATGWGSKGTPEEEKPTEFSLPHAIAAAIAGVVLFGLGVHWALILESPRSKTLLLRAITAVIDRLRETLANEGRSIGGAIAAAAAGLVLATAGVMWALSLESPLWQALLLMASCLVAGGCLAGTIKNAIRQPDEAARERVDEIAVGFAGLFLAVAIGIGAGIWVYNLNSRTWQTALGIAAGVLVLSITGAGFVTIIGLSEEKAKDAGGTAAPRGLQVTPDGRPICSRCNGSMRIERDLHLAALNPGAPFDLVCGNCGTRRKTTNAELMGAMIRNLG